MDKEVDEDKDVHQEDKKEDDDPPLGDSINTARRVLLCSNASVEPLGLGLI